MSRIVIVGAGVIGLYCAARLARAGGRVTVLEAEKEDFSVHAPAASLAAAGMLSPLSETSASDHPAMGKLALDSFFLWRQHASGALWEDGVRFDGAAVVAGSEAQAAELVGAAEKQGASIKPINPSQWRKRTGFSATPAHTLFIEEEGVVDPIRVLSGLCMEARRYGAQVRFSQDAEMVSANEVRTYEGGVFEADHVVLAPGAWASDRLLAVAPALKQIRPAKGHMIPVALDHPLNVNLHTPDFYLARRGEDDVVLGATLEMDRFERNVDPARVAGLLGAADALLPGEIRARTDAHAWAGIRPMSPDSAPLIGRSGEVLIASGHSRNGWLLAPITAEIISAYVFGETLSPLWAAFAPDRF